MNIEVQNIEDRYDALVEQIATVVAQSKQRAVRAVNNALVEMNWNIGKYIVEYEQSGNARRIWSQPDFKAFKRSDIANRQGLFSQ